MRDDGRQLPGRLGAGQDAIRLRLVVPRPERRRGRADKRAVEHGPAQPVRRHANGLAQLPVVSAARVFPQDTLQHARQRRRSGTTAKRYRSARQNGRRHLLQ